MVVFSSSGRDKLSLNFRENWKDASRLGLGQKKTGAPPGTVPLGDGWYSTPDDAADPWDCDRWPNSPYCKVGLPDLKTPFSIDISPEVHQCGFDIEMSGVAFWLPLPTNKLSYRYEGECRKEPPPPPPPTDQPGTKTYRNPYMGIDPSLSVFAFIGGTNGGSETGITYENGRYVGFSNKTDKTFNWTKYNCPGTYQLWQYGNGTWYNSPVNGLLTSSQINDNAFDGVSDVNTVNSVDKRKEWDTNGGSGVYFTLYLTETGQLARYENSGRTYYRMPEGTPTPISIQAIGDFVLSYAVGIFKGSWSNIELFLKAFPTPQSTVHDEMPAGQSVSTGYLNISVDLVCPTSCGDLKLNPYKKNPPPNDPCRCDMSCCPDYSSAIRQLTAEIKKINTKLGEFPVSATIFDENENEQKAQSKSIKLQTVAQSITKIIDRNEKISKIIGIDSFPLELPESVIVHPESSVIQKALNFLNPFKNTKIYSVMDLLVWKIKQDSAVLGQWGQMIQVQSTEKKKVMVDGKEIEKEQTKTEEVVLPNIAQTMKEQMLLQSQQLKTLGMTLDCVVKLLMDLAQTKAIAAETVRRVEDIQQYLDYPTNEKTVEVPVQITFPNPKDPQDVQNDIFKLLQEGKIKIVYDDWTGEHSQDEKLLDLLQAAKTIQGVYFSKGT